jgi:flagellar hook-length control protein FliK
MDAAGLHVRINAANNDVRTMINGQLTALVESLQSKGIEVVEVEVAYTGVNNGAFKDSQEGQAHPDRPRRPYRAEKIEDGTAYYAALQFDTLEYYLDTEVSSVEYRA